MAPAETPRRFLRAPGPHVAAFITLILLASPLAVQGQPPPGDAPSGCEKRTPEVRIPLNDTGIADLRFLNPRKPYPLVKVEDLAEEAAASLYRDCLKDVRLVFDNQASGRSFIVSIPFRIRSEASLAQDLLSALDELRQTILILAGSSPTQYSSLEKAVDDGRKQVQEPPPSKSKLEAYVESARNVLTESEPFENEPLVASQRSQLKKLVNEVERTQNAFALLVDPDEQCGKPLAGGLRSCSFQVSVPGGTVYRLSVEEWQPVYSSSTEVIELQVAFFDEDGKPSNATGYLRAVAQPKEEPSKTTWAFTTSASYAQDPETDADPTTTDKTDPFTVENPYAGDQQRRLSALGRLDLEQTLGDRAKATAQLTFKAGDLGEFDTTRDLEATQYQVEIFGKTGVALRYGKYAVAAPSRSIAVAESGEALELAFFSNFSLSHLIKRESLRGFADDTDRDAEATIFQGRNFALGGPLRMTGSFLALYGRDNRLFEAEEEEQDDTILRFDYTTFGGELTFAWSRGLEKGMNEVDKDKKKDDRPWPFSGSLALYRSEREVQPEDLTALGERCATEQAKCVGDGKGTATLLTLNWTRILIEKESIGTRSFVKTTPLDSVQLLAGYGTGDDPATDVDEGYLGETAGFAPDKLFLGRFARVLDAGDDGSVGSGLSNKTYLGAAYVNHRWSLLRYGAKRISGARSKKECERLKEANQQDPSKDCIVSESTTVRLHRYEFNQEVFGSRDAGWEFGIDFEIQVPKGVKSTLGFGYFVPGDALEELVADDAFIVTTSISVTLK